MGNLLEKFTFRFLIGQLIPGFMLALAIQFRMEGEEQGGLHAATFINFIQGKMKNFNDLPDVGAMVLFSVFLGMILQGLSELMAANIESFRIFALSGSGEWVKQEEPRKRSRIRKWIASLWSKKPLFLLGAIAPPTILFNLISLLAARPQYLYREICLVRSKKADADLMAMAITEYQYMADYFSNMGITFLFIFILELTAIHQFCHWHTAVLVLASIYGMTALSYVLSRIAKISVDHAIFSTIPKP